MANRRKTTNEIPVASVTKLVGVVAMLGVFGLCYVDLSNRVHRAGDEITKLEAHLRDVETETEVVRANINKLSSRIALQRRLNEGFITMVPISQDKIVRITPSSQNPEANEIRTVANEGTTP